MAFLVTHRYSLTFGRHQALHRSANLLLIPHPGQVVFHSHATLRGPVFKQLPVPRAYVRFNRHNGLALGSPFGAFRDFSITPGATDPDPGDVLVGVTNGGATTNDAGTTSNMRRFYLSAAGPSRAKYVAAGMKFASMPNNTKQYLDGVQMEVPSLGAAAPAVYSPARGLVVFVKPTRLNYVRNSNMNHTAATDNWVGDQLTSNTVVATIPWTGLNGVLPSMQVVVPSTAPAGGHPDHRIYQTLTDLLPGRTYTVSWRITKEVNCAPIHVLVDNAYGMDDEGGFDDSVNDRWNVIWATFTATATSHAVGLAIRPQDKAAGITNTFYFTAVLAEEAFGPRDYFDGEDGSDYLYEAGVALTKNARSFFYEDRVNRSYLLRQLLDENSPLGVIPGTPKYGVVPSQSLAPPVTAPVPVHFPTGSHQAPGYPGSGTNLGNSQLGGNLNTNLGRSPLGPIPHH